MTSLHKILAIETATASCSVALSIDGEVTEVAEVGSNIHSKVVLSMVDHTLKAAGLNVTELDAIVVGQGPGSFTGLRIGVGVAQGLAYGANCPMIGVSSLDALAMQSNRDGHVIAAIDARMGELYWTAYQKENTKLERIGIIQVSAPSDVSGPEGAILVGNGWSEYSALFDLEFFARADHMAEVVFPSAAELVKLAIPRFESKELITAAEFAPIYVRNDVAKKSVKR